MEESKRLFQTKETEINELNKTMLKMQDEKRDQEAKLENIEDKEHELKEEIITLKDIVKGKD